VTTAYIFVGIFLEEHDLVGIFGDDYRRHRQRVSMLIRGVSQPERRVPNVWRRRFAGAACVLLTCFHGNGRNLRAAAA